jgi:hypothetical protein
MSTRIISSWTAASTLVCLLALGFLAGSGVARAAAAPGSLEARLQAVEDRQAIEQLMMGDYCLALDRRLWKDYAATFTEDGELVQGKSVTKGRKAIEALMSQPRAPAPGAPPPPAPPAGEFGATKHVVTNLNLKLNGDTATATAYWQTIAIRPGGATAIASVGHYIDQLKNVNGKWLFTRREIVNPLRPDSAGSPPPPAPR